MISPSQSLPPLTVISGIAALNQNTAGQTGSQHSGEQRAGGEGQQFKSGQEVAVKVVANNGDGRYTLVVGNERIEVQSRLPLQEGQQLNMLVQEEEDGLVLAFKGVDVGQFLTRAMATGGSSQALGMIFGQGLAAQAAGGKAFVNAGGEALSSSLAQKGTGQGSIHTATAAKEILQQDTLTTAAKTSVSTATVRNAVRLPVLAATTKMVGLQQQFVEKSIVAQVQPSTSRTDSVQFSRAVDQFTAELGRQITPLFGQGKVEEAMERVASALRSLAPFFPLRSGGGLPTGLTSLQQQLLEAFSAQQSMGSQESGQAQGAGQAKGVALDRVIQHLQGQLIPLSTSPGEKLSPPQNPQMMLAALNTSLHGLQELIHLPVSFQQSSVRSSVFRSGLDGLFAFHLSLGAAKTGASSTGLLSQSVSSPFSSFAGTGALEGSTGVILQQLVDALGLDMEKLLAKGDVRGAAQGLKFQLLRQVREGGEQVEREMQMAKSGGERSKDVERSGLLRQVGESHQALQSLNFLQLLQANLDKQGILALPLALPFLEQGFLLMEKQGKERGQDGENDEGTRFSVLMKLSSLGNVRIDLLQTKESIYARFHAESAEVTKLFRESQQELRQGLIPLQLQGISYSSDPPGDPVAVLLQKCEGKRSSSLFQASV